MQQHPIRYEIRISFMLLEGPYRALRATSFFMVLLLFGEMGQALLLEGARVLPHKATELGFFFHTQHWMRVFKIFCSRFIEIVVLELPM